MNRFYLAIGNLPVHYYGLILGAAILAAYFLARKQAWRFGLSTNEVDKYTFWLVLSSFLGARVYFVLFNLGYYSNNLLEALQIWRGGLLIFGAIITGGLFSYFFARKKAYGVWQLLDLTALVLPLGQAIGRLGNFINYEAFGTPTDLPWKMFVPLEHRPTEFMAQDYFHPAFLYEAVGSLLLFVILWVCRKRLRHGQLALTYAAGYAFIRFFMEFLRTDIFWVGGVNGNQAIAGIIFILAIGGLIWKKAGKMV